MPGVGRDCYLYARPTKYIQDIRVAPDLDKEYKNATLNITLKTSSNSTIDLKLLNPSGKKIASALVKGKGKLVTEMQVTNPQKWSGGNTRIIHINSYVER